MQAMQISQRLGAYAVLMEGLLIAIVMVMFGVVLPSQGFVPTDFTNFAKVAPIIPSFNVVNVIVVLRSIVFPVVVLALRDRMAAAAPDLGRVAVIGAGIASALLLAQGMLNLMGWPVLLQNPSAAPTAGVAVQAVSQSLIDGSQFAEGWVAVLVGWAALSSKSFSAPLSSVILLSGVLSILAPFIAIALPVAIVLWVVWHFWLGIALLHSGSVRSVAGVAKA